MQSESIEDYLKAIYEIVETEPYAKTSVLAAKLSVSPSSVTDMIKRLSRKEPPLVAHQLHRGVTLTAEGERLALNVIRRHRLLETFLHDVLGFSWEEVHEEAETLEHYVSERMTDAIDAHLGHPGADPHGDPIPDKSGKITKSRLATLSSVDTGKHVRIVRIRHQEEEILRYLKKIGITIGTHARIEGREPFQGPVHLHIPHDSSSSRHSIGFHMAEGIEVEIGKA